MVALANATYNISLFVLAFRQTPQAFFQSVPVITFMVLLFIALALAMFGLYTLQLPSALQTSGAPQGFVQLTVVNPRQAMFDLEPLLNENTAM